MRKRTGAIIWNSWRTAVLAATLLQLSGVGNAHAAPAIGACCAGTRCDEVTAMQCEAAAGDFFGDGTSCTAVACEQFAQAPVLSAVGVAIVLASVLGASAVRELRRRRSHALHALRH